MFSLDTTNSKFSASIRQPPPSVCSSPSHLHYCHLPLIFSFFFSLNKILFIVKESKSYYIGPSWILLNFHIHTFCFLTNDSMSSEFSSFKFVILRLILGKEKTNHIQSHSTTKYGFVVIKFRSVKWNLINISRTHDQICRFSKVWTTTSNHEPPVFFFIWYRPWLRNYKLIGFTHTTAFHR